MNCFEGGYVDQLKGACREDMLEGQGADATAYRAGARTCRADLDSEALGPSIEEQSTLERADRLPSWRRRLGEFRAMAGITPKMELGPGWIPTYENPDNAHGEKPAEPIAETDHTNPAINMRKAMAPGTSSTAKAHAFADPEPGAKKHRKAKPADEGQATFL